MKDTFRVINIEKYIQGNLVPNLYLIKILRKKFH